ncbi:MAG TPA: hypothetical protein VFD63_02830 [Pyrinomonadaceae bacterium]|nr:hypothetical protein [Pyrinomonadaceae bacterium]
MRRTVIGSVVVLFVLSILAAAAGKPNFTGSWTMDRGRSFGMPGDMQQTMTVTQNEETIELETKLIQPNNERSVKDTYILDGKEHEFTPPVAPGQPPAKGKRTSTWLPAGNGIMVTEATTAETPKGPATTNIVRKWTLSAQGELVIDMYVDNPNASYETKRIFLKK